ncbi:unnamed protein product [Rodentolepis nana]|uniref:ER membrane protein complex subunit 1 n=1 Tax=Rodentolepis nana TaxID=102285 RepID=A0A0R3TB72_RODNA|nr:unnamed protein product [Rodentolepis nana]
MIALNCNFLINNRRRQYIGNVVHHICQPYPHIYVTSDSHVLGAIASQNGSLIWRHALEENARFMSTALCSKYLFTLSTRSNPLLRAWNPKSGQLHAEIHIKSDSSEGNLVCDMEKNAVFVVLTDKIVKVDTNRLIKSDEKSFPGQHSKLIASKTQDGILNILLSSSLPTNSLSLIKYNTESSAEGENDLSAISFHTPSNVQFNKCIFTKSVLICTGVDSPKLFSVDMKGSSVFSSIDLQSHPLDISEPVDGKIFVKYPLEIVQVFTVDMATNTVRSEYSLEGVSAFAVNGDRLICVEQLFDKPFENLQITSFDIRSGSKISALFPAFLNLSSNHGAVKGIDVLPGERGGLLVFTEDRAVQLISKEGEEVWIREESLADIVSVEMIDLSVSPQEATMQEEFGQSDASVIELFVNRIRSQFHQLVPALKSWGTVKTSSSSFDNANDFTPLIRDDYNLHKMLVIVTSVGKIFGIESFRGRVMWEYYIPGTRIPVNSSSQHLFAQRSTGHFPLTPVISVLLEDSSSHSILLYLDPILGVPLNAMTLKPAVDEKEAVVKLGSRVKIAALVPSSPVAELAFGTGDGEAANHVQALCVMMEDLKVQFMPPALANVKPQDLLPENGLFLYTLTSRPAGVTGYKVVASGSGITTKQIWHMHLSSDDCPQRILRAAAHPSNEHVHSIGRILGDRNVMYKYINPNLLAVMTEGVSAVKGLPTISLYLIDTVVGQIIHSVVHRKAAEPTSLVVSENWVLYSVYNQRSLRTEFTVMELFEPKQTTDNLVPSPWEIMISSLLPSTGSAFFDKSDKHNHFSSFSRAAHSAHGGKNEGVLIPDLLQRVFILASPLRSGALAVSLTERGITAKSLLFGLEAGNILELPKSLLDPRRTLDHTPQLQEEGLEAYAPELPMSTLAIISYNQTLERIKRIHTAPSGLESTSLVFAHGLDLFFTRIAPSKTYDMLRDDFDYLFIATIVIGMAVASIVARSFAARKELAKAWR